MQFQHKLHETKHHRLLTGYTESTIKNAITIKKLAIVANTFTLDVIVTNCSHRLTKNVMRTLIVQYI